MRFRRRGSAVERPLPCREVGKVLQLWLDEALDNPSADLVAAHLEDCRRCGLEAVIYREIKATLARQGDPLPDTSMRRLRHFSEQLVTEGHP